VETLLFCFQHAGFGFGSHQNPLCTRDFDLIGGDFFVCVTQAVTVIERHMRDNGYERIGGIGGVPASAESDFDDGGVHFFARELP
jgi:hypothetical protein